MTASNDGAKAKEIGRRIAQARVEAGGMTQEELGALVKVTARSIQAYEAGEVIPYRYLRDLERSLGKPAAWFLHGDAAMEARDSQFEEILEAVRALDGKMDALLKHVAGTIR